MPVKLINELPGGVPMKPTPKEQIKTMVDEYRDTLHSISTRSLRQRFPDRTFPDGSPFCEAHSAWVSKSEIEALLSDNKGSDGIRIYYGCHKDSTIKEAGAEYQGLHNVILVATKTVEGQPGYKSSDMLKEGKDDLHADSVIVTGITGYDGVGGDLVPLCPPRCPVSPL